MISKNNKLFFSYNEYNGGIVESVFADKQFIEGKGAGAFPTASAVLSDLSALTYDYRYEYKKVKQNNDLQLTNNFIVEVLLRFEDLNIPFEDFFIEITEKHYSQHQHYLIGKINFGTLIKAEWINRVSIVLTERGIFQ